MTLEVEQVARNDPDAVRSLAAKCDDPLRQRLLQIVNDVEDGETA